MSPPPLDPRHIGALATGRFDTGAMTTDLARALIGHRLAIATAACIPGGAAETPALRMILARRRTETMRMMQVLAARRRVSGILDAAGIDHLTIKGPALAVQTTGHWQGRPATDIDLLIAPDAAARAHRALTGTGFARRDGRGTAPGALHRWAQCELVYTGPPAVPLDLHWRMEATPGLCDLDFGDLWARRCRVDIDGQQVQTLDPVDALLVTAVHGAKSGWNRWAMILDAYRQWAALSPAGREAARARARAVGCARPLALMLALLHETAARPAGADGWQAAARAVLARTARAQAPAQSIPAALARLRETMRMAPGPRVAAGGLLRAALRPLSLPGAYRVHLEALLSPRPPRP